jgi:hypothetical protein
MKLVSWIIIVLLVGVIISLVFFNCSFKNLFGLGLSCHLTEATSQNDVNICGELSRKNQISICYQQYALQKKDVSVCEDIPDRLEIMTCYRGLAQEPENSVTLCKNLPEGVEKPNCYAAFIHVRWNANQEILCDKLKTLSDKNYCYMVTSIAKNDPNFCENIDTSEFITGINDCKRNVVEQNSNR